MAKLRRNGNEPFRSLPRVEVCNGRRQQQQRRGEDRRDNARRIELERKMRGLPLKHAIADLPLGILNRSRRCARSMKTIKAITATAMTRISRIRPVDSAPCRPSSSVPAIAEVIRPRYPKDDERDAVADPSRGDLLAKPHQKHRAAGQRHRGGDTEEPARDRSRHCRRLRGRRQSRTTETRPAAP